MEMKKRRKNSDFSPIIERRQMIGLMALGAAGLTQSVWPSFAADGDVDSLIKAAQAEGAVPVPTQIDPSLVMGGQYMRL